MAAPLLSTFQQTGDAHSLQKGALIRALCPSWIDPHPSYSREAQLFHRVMGSNTPPGPVSSLTCLSYRTDPGEEATQGLFSAPNLDHGPHQGWDQGHRGPQRAPDFCSSPFHTWLPFFSFLQEVALEQLQSLKEINDGGRMGMSPKCSLSAFLPVGQSGKIPKK